MEENTEGWYLLLEKGREGEFVVEDLHRINIDWS